MLKKSFVSILIFSAVLSACDTTEISTTTRCDIDIPEIEESFTAGEAATILAYPMTEKWDTLVEFDGVEAEISEVKKEDCEDCEGCRELYGCTECDYCNDCEESCQTCVHSVDIIVPSDLSEEAQLVITNAHGTSDPQLVLIEAQTEE